MVYQKHCFLDPDFQLQYCTGNFLAPIWGASESHEAKRLVRKLPVNVRKRNENSDLEHPNQKNPRVRKIRVRNSGAGNGCANFMDTWKKCVLSAGKPMSIKFCVFGGGWGGGGGVPILFLWARGFF